jgi:C4-dicarboxylate transporter, DctM subunit
MSTLYFGVATPTEAAALGCLLALAFAKIWGTLSWADFRGCLRSTVRSSGNLLFIIYTAYVFAYAISVAGVGELVTQFIVGLNLSRLEFFLVLFLLYTLLGCLVESLGMIVITVPLLFPVLLKYGIDPVWFGIILVLFIEMGQISPPIGINLFVIQSISREPFGSIVLGTIPFHLLMLVLLFLLVLFPELALWLPSQMSAR